MIDLMYLILIFMVVLLIMAIIYLIANLLYTGKLLLRLLVRTEDTLERVELTNKRIDKTIAGYSEPIKIISNAFLFFNIFKKKR